MKPIESAECYQPGPFLSGGSADRTGVEDVWYWLSFSFPKVISRPSSGQWLRVLDHTWSGVNTCCKMPTTSVPKSEKTFTDKSPTLSNRWSLSMIRYTFTEWALTTSCCIHPASFPVLVQVLWVHCLQYEICAEFHVASSKQTRPGNEASINVCEHRV